MSSVDDRIVNMKFNNSQFSQGVDKTKRDLTGLEKSVTSMGKAKGMTELGSAADGVKAKFSALQVVGATALATITAKATSAALNLVKKFTIQPLLDGFREYQTGLESVQTIMTNTGKSVGTVNKYLDELNHFSDQTIYNFGQMAKNIGTFTAAGVDLKTSTSAIKGIANIAAASGASSEKASRAMYQLSQAIAAGKVGLMDWNSVVNADMGGKLFKNSLAQTAVAMGDLSSSAVKVGTDVQIMGQSFRNSISAAAGQESWLTSKVLVTTLAQMDGRFSSYRMKLEGINTEKQRNNILDKERAKLAKQGVVYTDEEFENMVATADKAFKAATVIKTFPQLLGVVQESIGSMFAQGFEIVMGDFNESKKLWSSVGGEIKKVIDGISMTFLGALNIWSKRGGRDKVLEGLGNIFGSLLKVMKAVAGAWRDVFPKSAIPGENVSILFRLSKAFKFFTKFLVPSKAALEDIRSAVGGVFAVFKIGFAVISGVTRAFANFFAAILQNSGGATGGVLSFAGGIGEAVKAFADFVTQGGKLSNFIAGIGTAAGAALAPFISTISAVVGGLGSLATGGGLAAVQNMIDGIIDALLGLGEAALTGLGAISTPFGSLGSFFDDLAEKISGFRDMLNFSSAIEGGGAGAAVAGGLGTMFDKLTAGAQAFVDYIQTAFGSVTDALDTVRSAGSSAGDTMKSSFDSAKDSASDMADTVGGAISSKLSGSLDKVADSASSVKDETAGMYDNVASATTATASASGLAWIMEKLGSAFSVAGDIVKTMATGIGDALGWMADKLSNIPFPDDALEWATVLNGLLSAALIKRLFFSKGLFGSIKDTVREVGQAVRESFGELTNTLQTMQTAIKAEMIKNIAIAVALLVASLAVLAYIPAEKMKQGLVGLAGAFSILGVMMLALSKVNTKMSFSLVAAGLVGLASAVLILSGAIAILGSMSPETLSQGLEGLAKTMAIITVATMALAKNSAAMAGVGAGMVGMAVALNIMVGAIAMLGNLDPATLSQGITAVAKTLAAMTISMLALSAVGPRIMGSAAAMILMATALNIITLAIATLGALPADVIQQGLDAVSYALLGMTASLLALAIAGPSTMAAGAALLMLAGAMAILIPMLILIGSVPFDVVSQGLYAMAAGFAILLISGLLAMSIIPGLQALALVIGAIGFAMLATGVGFLAFATGLSILVALGAAGIAIMTAAIGAFILLLPNIAIQMAAAFVTFIQAIALAAPKIRKAFTTIFVNIIGTIRDAIPEVKNLFKDLIEAGLEVIALYMSRYVLLGVEIVLAILEGLAENIPKMIDAAYEIAYAFIDGMGERAVDLANAGADALIEMLNGLSDAIETKGPQIREAMGNLAKALKEEFIAWMESLFGDISVSDFIPKGVLDAASNIAGLFGRVKAGGGGKSKFNIQYERKGEDKAYTGMERFSVQVQNAAQAMVDQLAKTASELGKLTSAVGLNSKQLQQRATYLSTVAESRQSSADIARESADESVTSAQGRLDKAKDMKKGPKKAKQKRKAEQQLKNAKAARKEAAKRQKEADAAQAKADLAQLTADYEAQREADAKQYKDDPGGLGDAKSTLSADLSTQSAELAAQAQARRDEAQRLDNLAKSDKKNAKKYHDQARELRKQAAAETAQSLLLAAQSIEAQAAAAAAYAEARRKAALETIESMEAIRQRQLQEAKDRKWQEDYNKAKDLDDPTDPNDVSKESMLRARVAENTDKAAKAQDLLNQAMARSDALNAQIAANPNSVTDEQLAQAQADLVAAQNLAQEVSNAQDAIAQDLQTIEQLTQQTSQNNTATGGTSNILPSRTALEDAAKAVDRYTASVAQAEEMAGAGASTTQFVQNNYSPEALSASTIYRQGKNLISAAQAKMDV